MLPREILMPVLQRNVLGMRISCRTLPTKPVIVD